MAIVSFDHIEQLRRERAGPIHAGDILPAGPIDNPTTARTSLYDPVWGYFAFGQKIGFEYTDADSYQTEAQFTIRGTFSVNAEFFDPSQVAESMRFNTLVSKYEVLEQMFTAAAAAAPPPAYSEWFTASDPRVIQLPSPLVDENGQAVMAMPVALRVEQSRFPESLSYIAQMKEAKKPRVKMTFNSIPMDECQISIDVPSPSISSHRPVSGEGALCEVVNYSTTRLGISASVACPSTPLRPLDDTAREVLQHLTEGRATIRAAIDSGVQPTIDTLWSRLLIEGVQAQLDPSANALRVSFSLVK